MGQLGDPACLPTLLGLLARHETRAAARDAFEAFGPAGLAFLEAALRDTSLPRALRRHVPRALLRFAPGRVATVLVPRLLEEPDGGVRYRVLRTLGRLVARHPELTLATATLDEAVRRTAAGALSAVRSRQVLIEGALQVPARASTGHALLLTLLRDREAHAVERLFRLLGLRQRGEDWGRLYRGLASRDAKVRASSRELLENALRPPLREAVLALTDDAPEARRLDAAAAFGVPEAMGYEELLTRLLDQTDETLRCLAAYHVGELRLLGLRERLEALAQAPGSPFFTRVIERALALLDSAPTPSFQHAG
jgi:HEAT repeat protein